MLDRHPASIEHHSSNLEEAPDPIFVTSRADNIRAIVPDRAAKDLIAFVVSSIGL